MRCHIELIDEPTGCLRLDAEGPFPFPYRYAVHFKRGGEYAEPFGFDHESFTPSEFQYIIRQINQATGKLVAYWRAVPRPHRVVQIDPGLVNGRIVMKKQHPPHVHKHASEAIGSDGAVDQNEVAATSLEAVIAMLRGQLKVTALKSVPDEKNPKLMHYSFDALIQD